MKEKMEFLKKVYLFHNIPEPYIRKLIKEMKIQHFPKGADIIREGETGDSMFILFSGKVSITKKMTLFADYQEMSRVDKALITLKDTDYAFFGEMSLTGETEQRSATVKAETDCVLGELPNRVIYQLINENPDFGAKFYCNLSKVLADRLRKANRDVLKLTTALTLALEE